PVKISRATGKLLAGGRPIRARYALADTSLALEGKVIAQDVSKRMALYRVNGPLRQVSHVTGVYGDTWSGTNATYTRFDCKGGSVLVRLQGDPNLLPRGNTVLAVSGFGSTKQAVAMISVPASATTSTRIPLFPAANDRCTVKFT